MEYNSKFSFPQKTLIGIQFLFVAFGATVLVPLLVGIEPSLALLSAGIGTLIFHLITKGKVPVFLGSSFAFIAPIIKATELYGYGRYAFRHYSPEILILPRYRKPLGLPCPNLPNPS